MVVLNEFDTLQCQRRINVHQSQLRKRCFVKLVVQASSASRSALTAALEFVQLRHWTKGGLRRLGR